MSALVNFLAALFAEGLQHRTINTIRSAISATHVQVDNTPIGQHPVVTRLMKGMYNSRSPKPRYPSSWKVADVTHALKEWGVNASLSLKQLTLKLCMLMALVVASRSSELAALDLRFRVFSPDGVTFRLPTLTKKRKAGAPPKKLFFGGFKEDAALCVVDCLQEYERRTRKLRPVAAEEPNKLFLSYVQPHKPVSSQRIANWLKLVLEQAGINTQIFSAHSTSRGIDNSGSKAGGPIGAHPPGSRLELREYIQQVLL